MDNYLKYAVLNQSNEELKDSNNPIFTIDRRSISRIYGNNTPKDLI
jgi:hypothetical protein